MKKLFVLLLFVSIGSVQAGGWFASETSETAPNYQVIEIVAEVTDETTRVTYNLGFNGNASNFVWLMPIYSELQSIEVADFRWNWRQQHWQLGSYREGAYNRRIASPDNPCGFIFLAEDLSNMGSGQPPVVSTIATFDDEAWVVDSAENIINWMTDNNYLLDDATQAILEQYQAEGVDVLALPMSGNPQATTGQIEPLTFTFTNEDDQVHIPTVLMSQSTLSNREMRIWVLGDGRAVPTNYEQVDIDFTALRSPNRTLIPIREQENFPVSNNYLSLREDALSSLSGNEIMTEYVGQIEGSLHPDFTDYAYVTRLFGYIGTPENDLILEIDSTAENFNAGITVSDYVDPIEYYGCSTERAYTQFVERGNLALLPDNEVQVDDFIPSGQHFSAFIPDGWVLSEGQLGAEYNNISVRVYAPEPVIPAEVITQPLETDIPMLFVATTQIGGYFFPQFAWGEFRARTWRWYPHDFGYSMFFGIATSDADWEANGAMYEAMIQYLRIMPYFQSDDYIHTLFLNNGFSVPYADDWQAITVNGDAVIMPDNSDDVTLRPLGFSTLADWDNNREQYTADIGRALQETYNLSDETITDIITGLRENSNCVISRDDATFIYPYETDERSGYIGISLFRQSSGFIEASAPSELFDDYDELLYDMVDASNIGLLRGCG